MLLRIVILFISAAFCPGLAAGGPPLGSERAVERHLLDGEEFRLSDRDLVEHGRLLFEAKWTREDGGGRPLTTGTEKRWPILPHRWFFRATSIGYRDRTRIPAPVATTSRGAAAPAIRSQTYSSSGSASTLPVSTHSI